MERIQEKIRDIKNSIKKVDEGLPEDYEVFGSMGLEKDGIYKNIEVAIQSSYDICALILKEENLEVPGDEESLPDIVADAGFIEDRMAEKLKDMKGFRNALAHRYGRIDDAEAYENIQSGLEDFQGFLSQIEKYLENKG